MSDDLSAFFAKKAQKSKDRKKKGIVSLDDVGQQLERKARIQELGDYDDDGSPKERESNDRVKVHQRENNEDSEWLDFSEKPSLSEYTFRDFTEQADEEIEEEKKGANTEAIKTWNLDKKEVVNDENYAKPLQKSVYQAPGQARKTANLDLTNEELFPSIENADKIEEKIKADEKKKLSAPKPEDQFETKRSSRYEPPRPRSNDDGYAPRSDRYDPPRGGARYEPPTRSPYTPNDSISSSPRPGSGIGGRRVNEQSAPNSEATPSPATEVSSWRSERSAPVFAPASFKSENLSSPAAGVGSAQESDNNWRSDKRVPAQQSPQRQINTPTQQPSNEPPKRAAYVPPSMRNKN